MGPRPASTHKVFVSSGLNEKTGNAIFQFLKVVDRSMDNVIKLFTAVNYEFS
jgi:hypothetical protein